METIDWLAIRVAACINYIVSISWFCQSLVERMNMGEIQIIVGDGQARFIYDDSLRGLMSLGKTNIKRASHVEPIGGKWQADMSPIRGPILGPFNLRSEALEAETNWIKENNTPIPN